MKNNQKKLFIHIPKNGGMTLRSNSSTILDKITWCDSPNKLISGAYAKQLHNTMKNLKYPTIGYQHARWRDICTKLQTLQSFAVVRNPWARAVSRYTFAMNGRKLTNVYRSGDYTFKQFLDEREKKPFFWHRAIDGWFSQIDYVTSVTGVLQCDILRFEYYQSDVMQYFNLKSPLNARNVSNGSKQKSIVTNKKDYREYFTDETYKIIYELYKDDIDFFGFTFNGPAIKNIWASDELL